jgi:hypothetical protein
MVEEGEYDVTAAMKTGSFSLVRMPGRRVMDASQLNFA